MLYAKVRGSDGKLLGSVVVDPTAPGGMRQQLQNIVQRIQGGQPVAQLPVQQAGQWQRQAHWEQWRHEQRQRQQPWQGQAQSGGARCHFRVNVGGQWREVTAPCPPGIPPGHYHHHQR
jgi:hypothetical protein